MNPLVIGIGAPTRGDDAVGIEVARQVRARGLPRVDVVEVEDALALVDLVAGRSTVAVVDAMLSGSYAGDVAVFDALPAPGFAPGSTHAVSVGQALELARVLGHFPARLFLVGVEIADTAVGSDLSDPVRAAIPHAADEVCRLLDRA